MSILSGIHLGCNSFLFVLLPEIETIRGSLICSSSPKGLRRPLSLTKAKLRSWCVAQY